LKQAQFSGPDAIDERLIEWGPERELYDAYQRTRLATHVDDYQAALEAIAALRPHVDLFFDKVLVNAKDAAVRANRLALLSAMRREFSTIADFSEIVTTSQEEK
jgi:glycyl-tRNA synthetase beta chain